jgi:protein SCO1/2
MNWRMKRFSKSTAWLCGLSAMVLMGCGETPTKESRVEQLPYYSEASFTPKWITPGDAQLDDFHRIPPFQLINQDGEIITDETFAGKIYITDFFFTSCPGICPEMTESMAVLQEEFLDDEAILLLSHSVTPTIDSVSVLKAYADLKGIQSEKWHLATGDKAEIYSLGRQSYFVEEDLGLEKTDDEFLHTENFVLIDHQGHIRGIYNGLKTASIQTLIADVKTLKKEMVH